MLRRTLIRSFAAAFCFVIRWGDVRLHDKPPGDTDLVRTAVDWVAMAHAVSELLAMRMVLVSGVLKASSCVSQAHVTSLKTRACISLSRDADGCFK